jgi:endogenous inhibitor of DNA gyrase (YacG/DUF329 family)
MSKQMLLLDVSCPNCQGSLNEGQKVHLDAYVPETHQDGTVYLSAVFGDQTVTTDLQIPEGATVEYRCPLCDRSVMLQVPCRLCGAAMASLNIQGGAVLEFCSRRGCRAHALGGFGDVDQMMALVNTMLRTPHD